MFSVSARPQTQSFMKNIWCFNFNKSFHFNVFLLIVQNEKQPELKSYPLSFHPLICTSPALKHSHFQVHKNCIACSDFWRERWGPQPSWNREVPLHQGASKDCTRKKAWLAPQLLTLLSETPADQQGLENNWAYRGRKQRPQLISSFQRGRILPGKDTLPVGGKDEIRVSFPIYINISNSDSKIKITFENITGLMITNELSFQTI